MGFLQHTISFAYTGTHADVDLKLTSMRLFNQIEEMLSTLSRVVIHRFNYM